MTKMTYVTPAIITLMAVAAYAGKGSGSNRYVPKSYSGRPKGDGGNFGFKLEKRRELEL